MKPLQQDHKYDDMIDLPHPSFARHPRMSMIDRAAQFSPFAALTGYEDAVKETARLTETRTELTEAAKLEISSQIQMLLKNIRQEPLATVTYYVPDERKAGGAYHTVTGPVRKIDLYERMIFLKSGEEIPIDEIFELKSPLFASLEESQR